MTRQMRLRNQRRNVARARLICGVSIAAMVSSLGVIPAAAQTMATLHGALGVGGIPAAATAALANPVLNSASTAAMAAAEARAVQHQAQYTQTLSLAQQAQTAARMAAASLNPNVPNGLIFGGLQPASNLTTAANDPTGLHTWDGASAPTLDGSTPGQIDITQNKSQAVLDWTTFNIGAHTTLDFIQKQNGVSQPGWIVLNRVVGQLQPNGLRGAAGSPTQILGSIKADGTVLVIDQNGIIFGAGAQINVNSLIATSLEIGHDLESVNGVQAPTTLSQRNNEFLSFGLLGYADQNPSAGPDSRYTFSAQAVSDNGGIVTYDPIQEGAVQVAAGATINSASTGFVIMAAPQVINSGVLNSPEGQVSLVSGRGILFTRSEGTTTSVDPNLRGLQISNNELGGGTGDFVINMGPNTPATGLCLTSGECATGIISAPQGYISLQSTIVGAVLDGGVLSSTTSVSRNGYINIQGANIQLSPDAVMAITPDTGPATIPQDPTTISSFKTSDIRIGDTGASIDIGANSLIYAPNANISIGADSGEATTTNLQPNQAPTRVFIDTGAVIDASGAQNVLIPASTNAIQINPVTQNTLQDSPTYRSSFLNGAIVYVDPRLSGVRSDGVAWIGSPLIPAASYYQQVGVTASQLMTTGGNVTVGAASVAQNSGSAPIPDVIVKSGALIDVSGGWRTYQAGMVQTTQLVDSSGQLVDIGSANPNSNYVGIYNGFTATQTRWGISQTFNNPLQNGVRMEGQYTEGRDAGTLTIKSSVIALDGQVYADAFAGPQQILSAQIGSAKGTVYGDVRALQAATSQLPSGGFLNIQALGVDPLGAFTGGGDISVVGSSGYTPVSSDFTYGETASFDQNGNLIIPQRPSTSILPTSRLDVISLNADSITSMGLSQLTLQTTGALTVTSSASVTLNAGGAFEALSGRSLTVNGNITAPAGSIDLRTADILDFSGLGGSTLLPTQAAPGSFDVTINGELNAAGRWVNDYNASAGNLTGSAWLNGGEITLWTAPRIAPADTVASATDANAPTQSTDISGSILVNNGAILNLTGGGYVTPTGGFNLSAKGGSLSLIDETNYFQFANVDALKAVGISGLPGAFSGFRVTTIQPLAGGAPVVSINPSAITAHVSIADGSILAHGFAGGGTFNLSAPQFTFGDSATTSGTALPLDFFSNTGFASYNIKSYGTDLIPNAFNNGLGGFNAVLATQVVTVGAGQTLSLSESMFSPLLTAGQISTLQNFATGGDLNTVLTPIIPTDAWDSRAVNLTLGGLIELDVANGGSIIGQAGGVLTVSQLWNQGTIRIPGGAIVQSQVLPSLYAGANAAGSLAGVIAVHSLSDVFQTQADGTINEGDANLLGLKNSTGQLSTNAQVAANDYIYLLGNLNQFEGVRLSAGSVTDLSGAAIVNPRAVPKGNVPAASFVDGIVIGGGALQTGGASNSGALLFHPVLGVSPYVGGSGSATPTAVVLADVLNAQADSTINLAGASAIFDRPVASSTSLPGGPSSSYAPTLIWSNGGALTLGSGGTFAGAFVDAKGGATAAQGGALTVLNPVLVQSDSQITTGGALSVDTAQVSANSIQTAGFDTFVAQGSLNSVGDVTLNLRGALFVTDKPQDGGLSISDGSTGSASRDAYSPTIGSGGAMTINASYVGLNSDFQSLASPKAQFVQTANNSVTFNAGAIDITGAVRFDQSLGQVNLNSQGDLRLIGVEPWQVQVPTAAGSATVNPSLAGQLAVNGNLTITAGQVYPTTGTIFTLSSASQTGLITFAAASGTTPATPYSAGGGLNVQAANIVQDGVIRVPLGTLNLGSNTTSIFAPVATQSLSVGAGSITSVSTDGLVIPYGTTTDQIEWFFSPTTSSPLTAPPPAVLRLTGANLNVASGATVDLKGGGDVYAYEFISGIGGSRDVLNQYNNDSFSGNFIKGVGYQYADGRQVYAIVPSLANASAAPYDPIYSANYSNLYSAPISPSLTSGLSSPTISPINPSTYAAAALPGQVGDRVYLSAAPGLAAGWYTLLPAQYALLPGGMRVVQDTGAATPPPGSSSTLKDGSYVVAGYFGVAGSGAAQATPAVFDVQSQSVFRGYSQIALTYGNTTFAAAAAHNGTVTPRLPIDAGRLILAPLTALNLNGTFETSPGTGGRGSEVDISGSALDIVGGAGGGGGGNAIVLTTASLSNLNAASLFLGGVRTDNADALGTTSLNVTSNSITVESGATLSAPEIILATNSTAGAAASLIVSDGASIIATGTGTNTSTGAYTITGSASPGQSAQGGFLRVANGPQRLVERMTEQAVSAGSVSLGAATLQGTSVEAESSGNLLISPNTNLAATNLALGADSVTFANSSTGLSGLVITPTLQAQIQKASQLTIQSPNALVFQSGSYQFGNLTLDSAGLAGEPGQASVDIAAGTLNLKNTVGNSPLCGATGAPACGSGALAISATQIVFGSGPLRTYGFGGAVTIGAGQGILFDGSASVDFGSANLTVNTPFIGDRGTAAAGATQPGAMPATLPGLALTTLGSVSITGSTGFTGPSGTPGSSLSISGQTVAVNGSTLRATAGNLTVKGASGVTVANGAILETPGYSKNFGDAAAPVVQSAPGGRLSLVASTGNISVDGASRLSIYGGQGQAGTLILSAPGGSASVAPGSLDAGPAGSGASLQLDTLSSFDLTAFVMGTGAAGAIVGPAFSGNVSITTGTGSLDLAAGDTLKATNVSLVANGGTVGLAGTIDVSGVNGGNASLYGYDGVHLAAGSKILAYADGYGATDTRQATGGNVTLGVDGAGAINVDQSALIDVGLSASDPNNVNRLVPFAGSNTTAYNYVAADQGGTVTFRAPVIQQTTGDTVNVTVQGGVNGANSIVLEGFQRWNLATVAADSAYTGVSIVNGQAVLDLSATGAGQANFLADNASGTLVQFIQNFNIAADYGNLGGLASLSSFHARPGVELDYSGDIVLKSNWNLGAGVVNIAGAAAAGLMAPVPGQAGEYYIIPGDEAAVFARYTTLTYRVKSATTCGIGSVCVPGEPGVLSLRAGGNLDLNGSITDGFFQFRDQTNPNYLNVALGGGSPVEQGYLTPLCLTGNCQDIIPYSNSVSPNNVVLISFPGQTFGQTIGLTAQLENPIPYSATANAPDAQGSLAGGKGDPLGSAQLFPLLSTSSGGTTAVKSWSYQLVGGADLTGAGGHPGVDPMATLPGANGSVTVAGQNVYSYQATAGTPSYADSLLLGLTDITTGALTTLAADQWYQAFLAQNQSVGLQSNAYTIVDFSSAPLSVQRSLNSILASFFADKPTSDWKSYGAGVTTTLSLAKGFMAMVSQSFAPIASEYRLPNEIISKQPIYATAPTLVRTGTGNIQVAAARDINLSNGANPTTLNAKGQIVNAKPGQTQLGGAAIYTAGHLADLGISTATNVVTKQVEQVDLAANQVTTDNFAVPPANGYAYGKSIQGTLSGYAGILIANPVYADGGGSVSLQANRDVLGRRDTQLESALGGLTSNSPPQAYSWIGSGAQPWRTGVIGSTVNGLINPQLFKEGVGTLAGGDISIFAGGNVSDLSVVSTASLTTASRTGASQQALSALVTLGGGNIDIGAQDLLGGRIDAASGLVDIAVRGNVVSDGSVSFFSSSSGSVTIDNTLRLRLTDATVSITSGGDVTLQGITALGISVTDSGQSQANLDAQGFYSPNAGVSIRADGAVTIANAGADVVTASSAATNLTQSAVYPGSLEAVSFTSNLDIVTSRSNLTNVASATLLYSSPTGTLRLLAAGEIMPLTIAMEDANPDLLPGAFTSFVAGSNGGLVLSGLTFDYPAILPNTTDVVRQSLHNPNPTHAGDPNPNEILAGGSIKDLIFNSPKQAWISAGVDLINTVFIGQNLSPLDVTRITAGRDIIGLTSLVQPIINNQNQTGPALPTLQGNTFVIGGPGSFFLEAGRDAGPFLNSAVTNGFESVVGAATPTGFLTYAGGIQSVGNLYNPWLSPQGASILTAFGVSKGENFDGVRDYYLDPAGFASLPDYLFQQTTGATGLPIVDRNVEIYQSTLLTWLKSISPQILAQYNYQVAHSPAGSATPTLLDTVAMALVNGQTVDYTQAFDAFKLLPEFNQRVFLLKYVYYNELVQTSLPTSPSYHQYSRGYQAVNTLFPGSYGYTQNDLTGGGNGSNAPVLTGNLDLRLATIQTDQGGDIYILGPGGEVLAGSTVATATQAQRRDYQGGALYSGDPSTQSSPYFQPSTIYKIPVGYEGVLALQGGNIDGFTDGNFLLNQSRLFTEGGGNISLWSSNANLNAGQGPKNSASFPPIAVSIDDNAYSTVNQAAGVSGAGIAAFQPDPNAPAPDVFLIAPRGTVDAGAAGVRSAGNIFVAAQQVANATNFQTSTGGAISGVSGGATVNVSAGTSAGAASAAAAQAAQAASNSASGGVDRTVITVDVLGYLAGLSDSCDEDQKKKGKCD